MNPSQVGGSGSLDTNFASVASPAVRQTQLQSTSDFRKLVQANQLEAAASSSNITVSAHARDRLKLRNISLNDDDLNKISQAMDRVSAKGGRQALLMVKTSSGQNTAMVVSIRNRVIITAVDAESLRDNVFTNIDSAAIVP